VLIGEELPTVPSIALPSNLNAYICHLLYCGQQFRQESLPHTEVPLHKPNP